MNVEQTKTLLTIIRKAGDIVTEAAAIDKKIAEKSGTANYVTTYDVAVQTYLIKELTALFPDAQFLAEEKDNDPACLNAPHCFIIDPIDGTTNFIHAYHHSTISVALFENGTACFGAVFNPYTGELFHAVRGGGAFCNEHPIHVADRPLDHALVAFGTSPYYKDTLCDKTFAFLKEMFLTGSDIRRVGAAALDLAGIADGRNDVFFEFILSPWDYAAGALLITEAGGVITSMTGQPLDMTHPTSVIAGNPALHAQILKLVAKYQI